MWLLFSGSFRKRLISVLGYDSGSAGDIAVKAKAEYRRIIRRLPEFEKADRFKMNIVNCAMLCAFLLNMPERPSVTRAAVFYRDAMMIAAMKWFCRKIGKKSFQIRILPE